MKDRLDVNKMPKVFKMPIKNDEYAKNSNDPSAVIDFGEFISENYQRIKEERHLSSREFLSWWPEVHDSVMKQFVKDVKRGKIDDGFWRKRQYPDLLHKYLRKATSKKEGIGESIPLNSKENIIEKAKNIYKNKSNSSVLKRARDLYMSRSHDKLPIILGKNQVGIIDYASGKDVDLIGAKSIDEVMENKERYLKYFRARYKSHYEDIKLNRRKDIIEVIGKFKGEPRWTVLAGMAENNSDMNYLWAFSHNSSSILHKAQDTWDKREPQPFDAIGEFYNVLKKELKLLNSYNIGRDYSEVFDSLKYLVNEWLEKYFPENKFSTIEQSPKSIKLMNAPMGVLPMEVNKVFLRVWNDFYIKNKDKIEGDKEYYKREIDEYFNKILPDLQRIYKKKTYGKNSEREPRLISP